jgi:DNA-binding NarL/FixJ family response regulator
MSVISWIDDGRQIDPRSAGLGPGRDRAAPDRMLHHVREQAQRASATARSLESQVAMLADALHDGTVGAQAPEVEVLEGTVDGDRRIDEAVERCRVELLVAHAGGPPGAETLRVDRARGTLALKSGAGMRALYQHSARHDGAMAAYVDELTAAGAEVRTIDDLFSQLVIVDRRIAFIPAAADRPAVGLVRHPVLVGCLADLFDHVWHRADPYLAYATQNITTPVQDLIIRMLVDGETGRVIAKRLGISDRTFAKRITRLKADYRAHTTFQLGYQIALHQNRPRRT